MLQYGNLHRKIILSQNSKQRKSDYWLACFNFRGLMVERIDIVNSYNWYKVESLKAKRYTWQSSDPMHPSKRRVIYHHTFSQMFMLTGNHLFLSLGGTVFTIVLPSQMHFLKLSHSTWLDRSSGRFLDGTNISITSANSNHQNCKPWCIYQVLKFPN